MAKTTAPCPYCNHAFAADGDDARDCPVCKRPVFPAMDAHSGQLDVWIPAQPGGFQITASIGQGGMGRLFKGENSATGECVAIKFPLAGQESDEKTFSRFEREINILKSLDHPNVVRFLSSGEEADLPYYIMEWIDGDDLGKVIFDCRREGKSLPFEFVYKCFMQLCRGLEAIHGKGIVHRDVKPSNIMLAVDGNVKLVDLGIARLHGMPTTLITQTMGVAGTNMYAAPEQLSNPQNVDHRADIFSLGLVTYEMLTGMVPRGNSRGPSALNRTVPKWFDGLLMKMLETDPDDRPGVVGDIVRNPRTLTDQYMENSLGAKLTSGLEWLAARLPRTEGSNSAPKQVVLAGMASAFLCGLIGACLSKALWETSAQVPRLAGQLEGCWREWRTSLFARP